MALLLLQLLSIAGGFPCNGPSRRPRKSLSLTLWPHRPLLFLLLTFVLAYILVNRSFFGGSSLPLSSTGLRESLQVGTKDNEEVQEHLNIKYDYLMGLATHVLAEGARKRRPQEVWTEPYANDYKWKPCADMATKAGTPPKHHTTGYIMVSASGGLNQQRVAVCNAVAVARLLNATLLLPRFIFSDVWQDNSQFGDIYQEDFFIDYLKDDVTIIKELPAELQSVNLQAIGSLFTGRNLSKEAKPSFYVTDILPTLLQNRIVHFYGFIHSLSFDPVPFHVQRLRCKCNFHALKFSSRIQNTAALMITRMKEPSSIWRPLAFHAQGGSGNANSISSHLKQGESRLEISRLEEETPIKYLALHLRFEIDMVAHSMCDFDGGENEQRALDAYRAIHFPTLAMYQKEGKSFFCCATNWLGCRCLVWQIFLLGSSMCFSRGAQIGFLHGDWERWWTVDEELSLASVHLCEVAERKFSSGTRSLLFDLLPADCCNTSLFPNLLY